MFRTHQGQEEFDVGIEGVNGEDSRVCGLEPGMGRHEGQSSGWGLPSERAGGQGRTVSGAEVVPERAPPRDAMFPSIPGPLGPWFE